MGDSQPYKYLEPDGLWKVFGTNSMEEHIEKNVVRGVFQKAVPEDVINDFKTIEYQQVNAYYHWQLMDEALNKGLRLLEMAIKLKAKELKIELTTSGAKPKDKSFNALINEVCKLEPLDQLKDHIHHLRNLRNLTTHKDSNSFIGGTGGMAQRTLMRLVNLINDLFLDPEQLKINLRLQSAAREFFVNHYMENLDIDPPHLKPAFLNEAHWEFEIARYNGLKANQ